VLGIEAENTGKGERWPPIQLNAYRRLAAALANGVGKGAEAVCGHREWAPGRKPDPQGIDMDGFRRSVAQLLGGPPPLRPPPESLGAALDRTAPPRDSSGTERDRTAELQRLVGTTADGIWGKNTVNACARSMIGWPDYVRDRSPRLADKLQGNDNHELVRWLQRQGNRRFAYNLSDDGQVGPATNHLIVVGLGQGDGTCGPKAFREVVR
jgi:hypothetical protein